MSTAPANRETIVVQHSPRRLNLLLALFVLVCTGVLVVDRYLVADSLQTAIDANDYNIRETARIVEVGQSQQRLSTAVDVIRELQINLRNSQTTGAILLQQNIQMHRLLEENGIAPSRPFDKDKDA